MLKSDDISLLSIIFSGKEFLFSVRPTLFIQYTRGNEWYGYGVPKTDEVLNQPKWMTQFRMYINVNKKVEIVLAANKQSSSLSKSVLYRDLYQLNNRAERLSQTSTWDLNVRVYLSNHFLLYFSAQNIFDREFQGLDATGTPDDLRYNPQPGRFIRLGVNYNMN